MRRDNNKNKEYEYVDSPSYFSGWRREGNRNEEEEKGKEESTNHHIFMLRCIHEIAVL